ncbi:MAG: gliding motility lipoprotein GldH [Prevotella sp.]|nr:gliding motility lipoprotein GldH [Prevotella sp.]
MKGKSNRAAAAWLAAVGWWLLAACNNGILYSNYVTMDGDGWDRQDTLHFITEPMEHAGRFAEEVGLRANSSFPFTTISIIVEQQALPSGLHRTDTISVSVTDKAGSVLGTGVSIYQYRTPLEPMKLLKGDTLRVAIRHNMVRLLLDGISDVGFTLSKTP